MQVAGPNKVVIIKTGFIFRREKSKFDEISRYLRKYKRYKKTACAFSRYFFNANLLTCLLFLVFEIQGIF